MATMTISEAEHIIDVFAAALQKEQPPSKGENEESFYWKRYRHHLPLSILQGYNVFQFDIALKMRIANMFLFFASRNNFEEHFAKEIKICSLPIAALGRFIPDDLLAKLKYLAELSNTVSRDSAEFRKYERPIWEEYCAHDEWFINDKKFISLETSEAFAAYCRRIGANDPIYWQKIYTRLGLEYTSSSPKGNNPVRA
ncbi:hypothetical protein ASZ90_008473 [hydrocarbon metagenome]|uniref:Uncharacterized protein n=1 Tax=hydrocarbon metagenome TaxID=938273 RepID=A0A0W8FLH5_9ZZZZ